MLTFGGGGGGGTILLSLIFAIAVVLIIALVLSTFSREIAVSYGSSPYNIPGTRYHIPGIRTSSSGNDRRDETSACLPASTAAVYGVRQPQASVYAGDGTTDVSCK